MAPNPGGVHRSNHIAMARWRRDPVPALATFSRCGHKFSGTRVRFANDPHRLGTAVVSPPVETELKLELPSSELTRLDKIAPLRRVNVAKRATQVSVYFDCDKFALGQSGVMLGVRLLGRCYSYIFVAAGEGVL